MTILISIAALLLLVCAIQLIFINWNLKEIIVLLCRAINDQAKPKQGN